MCVCVCVHVCVCAREVITVPSKCLIMATRNFEKAFLNMYVVM